jgi:hypothetical protein
MRRRCLSSQSSCLCGCALFLHSAFRARFHVAEETMILQGLSIESQYSRDVYHQTPNGGIIQDQAVQLDTAVC